MANVREPRPLADTTKLTITAHAEGVVDLQFGTPGEAGFMSLPMAPDFADTLAADLTSAAASARNAKG